MFTFVLIKDTKTAKHIKQWTFHHYGQFAKGIGLH